MILFNYISGEWKQGRGEGIPLIDPVNGEHLGMRELKTGDRVGYVVGQFPRHGTASAYDKITLIAEKSLHGVVPRVIGLVIIGYGINRWVRNAHADAPH